MKPFNLKKALAGAPVVTRDGREVTQLVHFIDAPHSTYTIHGVVSNTIEEWTDEGVFCTYDDDCELDLFMASKKVWVNLYAGPSPSDMDSEVYGYKYPSKSDADKGAGNSRIACVEIEISEDV